MCRLEGGKSGVIESHSEESSEDCVSIPRSKERCNAAGRRLEWEGKLDAVTYWHSSQCYLQILAIAGTLDHIRNNIVAERQDERLRRQARSSIGGPVEQQAALWNLEGVHGRNVSSRRRTE